MSRYVLWRLARAGGRARRQGRGAGRGGEAREGRRQPAQGPGRGRDQPEGGPPALFTLAEFPPLRYAGICDATNPLTSL